MSASTFSEAPYNDEEARYLREMGEQVVGCWFCIHEALVWKPSQNPKLVVQPLARVYWPEELTTIKVGEHVIRCPKHREER